MRSARGFVALAPHLLHRTTRNGSLAGKRSVDAQMRQRSTAHHVSEGDLGSWRRDGVLIMRMQSLPGQFLFSAPPQVAVVR